MRSFFLLLAAALLFAGCAADLSSVREDTALPRAASIDNLKVFEQEPNQCAAAALATLLAWGAPPGEPPEKLGPLLYNPKREGAFCFDLAREARLRGLLAYSPVLGLREVLAETAAGRPVAVLENRGLSFYEVNHWSVVAGYDLSAGRITLLEGKAAPVVTSLDTFSRTFGRAGNTALVALPPPLLPVMAPPKSLLSAISALESARGPEEALPFYQAFTARFPGEWLGRFALGNAHFGLGEAAKAEEDFLLAAKLAPERPEPLNNLALLAKARGRGAEAEAYAKEAVAKAGLLGLDPAPYETTRKEVSATP